MKTILFVCTGNVFRSITAKLALEQYLKENKIKDVIVDSAGISDHSHEKVHPSVESALKKFNLSSKGHKPKQITKELVSKSDVIIAIAKNHQQYIKKNFNIHVKLFNELVGEGHTSIKDIPDVIVDWKDKMKEADKFFIKTIGYIHSKMPLIYEAVKKG